MVGRKVEADETDKDRYLADIIDDSNQHAISSDVYHESGEKFSQAILKNEGVTKHFLRNFYIAIGMVVGVYAFVHVYTESNKFLMTYEDYLDWVVFQQVKKGRSVDQLARVFYYSDNYSFEGRTN